MTAKTLAEPVTKPDYDIWLAREIETGQAELDAGKVIPATEVWRQLDAE